MNPWHARRLASVDPILAGSFLSVAQDFATTHPGCHLGISQGYRTAIAQQQAFEVGRSKADGTTKFSKHQVYPSLALDFAVLDENGRYVANGQDHRYAWVGEHFKLLGQEWGGDWTTAPPDYDHVERPSEAVVAFTVDRAAAAYARATSAAPFLVVV